MPSEPSYQVGLDHLILQICFVKSMSNKYFVVIDVVAALTDSVNLQIIQSMHHKKNKQDK